jgi:predicted HAD superfamily Cof-like phosphohydrolase
MINQIEKLKEFNKVFKLETKTSPTLNEAECELRYHLMNEELQEYIEACKDGDLVEVADAIGDMLYILCGTVLTHGMQDVIEEVFNRIHESNLSKTDENGNAIINGENGVYDETRPFGKILKSSRYKPVDLKDLF